MDNKLILEINNLSVLMKERFLVKDVSFCVNKGECVGIIGEDKSGKTSLIKAISGSLPVSSGQVLVDGKNIVEENYVLKDVNICLDPPVFFKFQSVYENVKYLSALSESNNKEKIIKVLNKFNLAHKMKTKVLFLSYYEKKLMALALAFLTEPKLLLLDEPFKGLPPESVEEIKSYLQDIQKQGTTIIISTRNFETLEELCDEFIFMENRTIKKIMTNKDCKNLDNGTNYAFVELKYPHYAGKLIMDNFNLKVKVFEKKVLFEASESTVADIVKFITQNKIIIYKAGYLNKKAERILANLTPYFKEESE